ncbi:unnamed protein product [Calypogeia fissa]
MKMRRQTETVRTLPVSGNVVSVQSVSDSSDSEKEDGEEEAVGSEDMSASEGVDTEEEDGGEESGRSDERSARDRKAAVEVGQVGDSGGQDRAPVQEDGVSVNGSSVMEEQVGIDNRSASVSDTDDDEENAAEKEEENGSNGSSDFSDSRSHSEDDAEETSATSATVEVSKSANIAALVRGDLVVRRQPLLPKVLHVADGAAVARGAFKSPIPSHATSTAELQRRLSARKRFVPWQTRQPFVPLTNLPRIDPPVEDLTESKSSDALPPGIEPLVLWQAESANDGELEPASISVDNILVKFLRPHQREGVQFMFECVMGLRPFSKTAREDSECCGCILADDMGLGKTLQSITLLWTLLRQGFDGTPLAKRVLIVTPTSLVSNWESELNKWLNGRVNVMAVGESTRAEVISGITSFLASRNPFQVMIISYETFRLHAKKFENEGSCDLLVCDEAHRLKNDQTLTNQALASLHCRRRVLLSGTPMQNDLEEFYAMVNFTNPGILGNASAFRRYYENPILIGREPDATDEARALSAERSAELSEIVNQFILRRTNSLLSNHLPPKIVQVVCCKLTDLQLKLYEHFIHSKNVLQALEDKTKRAKVLASITALKKLCNHPKLIYDSLRAGSSQVAGFEDCMKYFPQGMFSSRVGPASFSDGAWIELSGKMAVLARLLANIRESTDDRIVLVSNYTQTLDLFSQICRERQYPYVRLDGTTSLSKRQKLVQRFNDPAQNEFAFLLSSKAGGCGLNLIGGNRLVLFDPDWNPATDKQAAARVWRDGQKKRVYLYRFFAAGTIEEKVYQRQISKEGLQKVVDKEQNADGKAQVNDISTEDLRDLFTLRKDTRSDTHEALGCSRCNVDTDPASDDGLLDDQQIKPSTEYTDIGRFGEVAGVLDKLRPWEKQIGNPLEEDLKSWAHHADSSTIPDSLLQIAACGEVTFAFTCQVDGKLAPVESVRPRSHHHHDTIGLKLRVRSDATPGLTVARPLPLNETTSRKTDLDLENTASVSVKSGAVATKKICNKPVPRLARTPMKRACTTVTNGNTRKKPSVILVDDTSAEESDDDDESDEDDENDGDDDSD